MQHDVIAHALNERLLDQGRSPVAAYVHELDDPSRRVLTLQTRRAAAPAMRAWANRVRERTVRMRADDLDRRLRIRHTGS